MAEIWFQRKFLVNSPVDSFFWQSVEAATRRALWKKVFLKILKKTSVRSLFLNKVAGPRPETLFKNVLCNRCFPVSLSKVLWKPLFIEHPRASESKMFCEISTGSVLWKKLLLKLTIFTGKTFVAVSCLQACSVVKKDSNTSVFLWMLQNF